jgi:antitoxin HicB
MIPMTNRDLEYYLALPYTIELTPDKEGFWFAEIPLLEGCFTNGSSREDALGMIDDAKRAWVETVLALGMSISEPERENA